MRNSQQVPGQSSKIDSGEDMEEFEDASRFAPSTKKPKIPEEDGESVDRPC